MFDLKTPIDPRRAGEAEQEFLARVERERLAKLNLIFEMFGIPQTDPGASQKLLVALLIEHYSGFRVRASGLKAEPNKTADDIILTFGVERRGSRSILHAH